MTPAQLDSQLDPVWFPCGLDARMLRAASQSFVYPTPFIGDSGQIPSSHNLSNAYRTTDSLVQPLSFVRRFLWSVPYLVPAFVPYATSSIVHFEFKLRDLLVQKDKPRDIARFEIRKVDRFKEP